VGRGPAWSFDTLFGTLGAYAFGLPGGRSLGPLYAAALAATIAGALRWLARRGDDRWILHLGAIALAPAAVLGILRPEVIAARYFVISGALALILFSHPLAAWLRAGGPPRAAATVALALFVAGNAAQTARFLAEGRGHYREALHLMAARSPGPRVEVGSNHDFRVGTMLRYYARTLPPDRELAYTPRGRRPPGGPAWFVVQRRGDAPAPRSTVEDAEGNSFVLEASYDFAGIAGYGWAVYRRAGAAPGNPGPGAP
jgi:hypothetical protein